MYAQAQLLRDNYAGHPKIKSRLNAYTQESLLYIGAWDRLEHALTEPSEDVFSVRLAKAMLHIRKGQYSDAFSQINEARQDQSMELANFGTDSYRRCYKSVLRLQILQDLEDYQIAFETAHKEDRLDLLNQIHVQWEQQLDLFAPSYEVRSMMLELRHIIAFQML